VLVLDPAADADPGYRRHQHDVVARQRDVGRGPGALAAAGLFGDLDEDLLADPQPLGDRPAADGIFQFLPADALRADIGQRQEGISFQSDVDERRFHPGQHAGHPPLVYVAGQRHTALDLYAGEQAVLYDGDADLKWIDRCQDILAHLPVTPPKAPALPPRGSPARARREGDQTRSRSFDGACRCSAIAPSPRSWSSGRCLRS
jgi:hypothetical protein